MYWVILVFMTELGLERELRVGGSALYSAARKFREFIAKDSNLNLVPDCRFDPLTSPLVPS